MNIELKSLDFSLCLKSQWRDESEFTGQVSQTNLSRSELPPEISGVGLRFGPQSSSSLRERARQDTVTCRLTCLLVSVLQRTSWSTSTTAACWVALTKRWWRCWSRCRWVRVWTWCWGEDTRCSTTQMDVPNRVWRRCGCAVVPLYRCCVVFNSQHHEGLLLLPFSAATDSQWDLQPPQRGPRPDTPHLQPNAGRQRQHARSEDDSSASDTEN